MHVNVQSKSHSNFSHKIQVRVAEANSMEDASLGLVLKEKKEHEDNEEMMLKQQIKNCKKIYRDRNKDRFLINEKIREKKMDRDNLMSQINHYYPRGFSHIINWKRNELDHLERAMHSLSRSKYLSRRRPIDLSFLPLPTDHVDLIKSLHCKIQHGSKTVATEKKLLRMIKEAESEREELPSHAINNAKIPSHLNSTEAIQHRINMLSIDIEELKQKELLIGIDFRSLKKQLEAAQNDISSWQRKLGDVNRKKQEACDRLLQLKKKRDDLKYMLSKSIDDVSS